MIVYFCHLKKVVVILGTILTASAYIIPSERIHKGNDHGKTEVALLKVALFIDTSIGPNTVILAVQPCGGAFIQWFQSTGK